VLRGLPLTWTTPKPSASKIRNTRVPSQKPMALPAGTRSCTKARDAIKRRRQNVTLQADRQDAQTRFISEECAADGKTSAKGAASTTHLRLHAVNCSWRPREPQPEACPGPFSAEPLGVSLLLDRLFSERRQQVRESMRCGEVSAGDALLGLAARQAASMMCGQCLGAIGSAPGRRLVKAAIRAVLPPLCWFCVKQLWCSLPVFGCRFAVQGPRWLWVSGHGNLLASHIRRPGSTIVWRRRLAAFASKRCTSATTRGSRICMRIISCLRPHNVCCRQEQAPVQGQEGHQEESVSGPSRRPDVAAGAVMWSPR
jgi:hypothetical protein